jgi:hypothetical protein
MLLRNFFSKVYSFAQLFSDTMMKLFLTIDDSDDRLHPSSPRLTLRYFIPFLNIIIYIIYNIYNNEISQTHSPSPTMSPAMTLSSVITVIAVIAMSFVNQAICKVNSLSASFIAASVSL